MAERPASWSGTSATTVCWRFNRADTFTFDGVISGAGSLHHIGPGTTILTGNHTYTGATLIGRGTVQVGAGSTTGRLGRGAIVNNGTLVFDRSDAVMVDHPISGSGALIQAGTGTLFLSGAHWYGGGTSVRAGALMLDGSLVGPVDVAAGATFNGVGSIGGSLTVNGTMIIAAPDGTHGALHIGENLTLASGSRAFMTLEASGGHSLLTAGGRAYRRRREPLFRDPGGQLCASHLLSLPVCVRWCCWNAHRPRRRPRSLEPIVTARGQSSGVDAPEHSITIGARRDDRRRCVHWRRVRSASGPRHGRPRSRNARAHCAG